MNFERGAESDSRIPTSSMSDIAFLLIIFFMVTAVFSATKGLDLRLPGDERKGQDPSPRHAVFVHVLPRGLEVDCRPVTPDGLVAYLRPRLEREPGKPLILYTDSAAEYRRMVEVYDRLAAGRIGARGEALQVGEIVVPTRSDIEDYIAAFGHNPLDRHCR